MILALVAVGMAVFTAFMAIVSFLKGLHFIL